MQHCLELGGLQLDRRRLQPRALLSFIEKDGDKLDHDCDELELIYEAEPEEAAKVAAESEKMSLSWKPFTRIPFRQMPADDEHWYPRVLLSGEHLRGSFTFDGPALLSHELYASDEHEIRLLVRELERDGTAKGDSDG